MNEFEKKMVDFKEIVFGLQNILDAENQALEKFDINSATSMYEKKNKAVLVYRDFVAFFIKNSQKLSELKDEDKIILREVIANLNENLIKNELLLKTRIEVSQNVMSSIISAAKNINKAQTTSYGAQGHYSQRERHYNAIAINQTL